MARGGFVKRSKNSKKKPFRFKKSSKKISHGKNVRKFKNPRVYPQVQAEGNEEKNPGSFEQSNVPLQEETQPLQLLLSTFNKNGKKVSDSSPFTSTFSNCSLYSVESLKAVPKKRNGVVADVSTTSNSEEAGYNLRNRFVCEKSEISENGATGELDDNDENSLSGTEDNVEGDSNISSDPFDRHFNYELNVSLLESLTSNPVKVINSDTCWQYLGNLKVELPAIDNENFSSELEKPQLDDSKVQIKPFIEVPIPPERLDWNGLFVKSQIQNNIRNANKDHLKEYHSEDLTPLQKEIFTIINNYQDLFYPGRTLVNGEEIRFTYCLHAVNHILKTRLRILHHNEKLSKKGDELVPNEYRDQGLVRPRVIIIVPFKESCLRIVSMISSILIHEDKGNVINKSRFKEEFSSSELIIPKINAKPEDYEELFKGNIDDKFKIGISFTKKSLKLYTEFYASDIIIASPLGLRTVVGAEGDKNRDFDFLASVELLILDQAELFLMQNWDHLLLILDHLHMQPKEAHGTDFSRIRPWVLNGWSKFYRQTILFSSIVTPELNSVFNRRCTNFSGKVRVVNPIESGGISLVIAQLSHVFQKFKVESVGDACDARFNYFIDRVLPQYRDPSLNGVLIYVPSYFDYVRIRNHLKREDYSFVQICEYSKDARIARARDKFFHKEARFLLYSERFHFFRRIKLKGIRHIIFYQLPTFPHFYSELCNLINIMEGNGQNSDCNGSVMVLYCKYDVHQLSAVVRTSRAVKLLSSDKDVHMFTTGYQDFLFLSRFGQLLNRDCIYLLYNYVEKCGSEACFKEERARGSCELCVKL